MALSDRITEDIKEEIREQIVSLSEVNSYIIRKNRKY